MRYFTFTTHFYLKSKFLLNFCLLRFHLKLNDICRGPTWHRPSSGTGTLQSPSASTGQIRPRCGTTIARSFRVRCSVRVRHPVLEQGTQCQHWVPISVRCQNGDEFIQCQHWVKKISQCRNWDCAEMEANKYLLITR